ncbi:MAG TPA: MBL fold metallo-hydrolase, partial [Kofleriaceae bacterium]|nr:MBL fold metallo-hydrolase [Kofleriaceae bacterium]
IHLIDVGTGLSILVQGPDFAMLFDGGSSDPDESPLRVVDYLEAALGPSGDGDCRESRASAPGRRVIDDVVLSHPHQDHASALDLVLHCFDVHDVWDSGAVNDAVFYRDFLSEVARDAGATYHTAADPPADRTVEVKGVPVVIPPAVRWVPFREAERVKLGAGAGFEILHAEGKRHPDPNQNSIVLSVDLGRTRLLLTGDAESGEREPPSAPPGDVEAHLLDDFRPEIDADILQVGHHGSLTSSRARFISAVSPKLALVSAGPKRFGRVRLPDQEIIDELHDDGITVLRTDAHDEHCDLAERIGPAHGPGGCDSYVITVTDPPATPAAGAGPT